MMLVIGVRTADPDQVDARATGDLAEIGVLTAIADVLLAEASQKPP